MGNERVSSGVAAFKQILVTAGLFYLLLPNLLFLLGWVQPYIAIPVSLLLIGATVYVCRKSKSGDGFSLSCKPFTIGDWILLLLTLVGMLFLTDLIGFHANIRQTPDFSFRNAIYAELTCSDWPIYSPRGEYFIYYHAFWLPPALLTKLCGGSLSPHTALFGWSYLGLVLMGGILFIELRKKFVLFAAVLTGAFSLSYAVSIFYYLYDSEQQLYALNGLNQFYLTNFWHNQLQCTFNHAIPGAVFLAIVLCKGVPVRYLAVPSALLFSLSPMAGVAAIPLLFLLFFQDWKANKTLPINVPTVICSVFVALVLIYLSGQDSGDSAALLFLWNDSPFWLQKSIHFTSANFRVCHAIGLCFSFLLPLFLLLDKKLRSSLLFKALVVTTIFISFVWIGRANNELLFKGSLILAFIQALLLTEQWGTASKLRKAGLALFFAVSFSCLNSGYIRCILHTYSWQHQSSEANLTNKWEWSLNHPEDRLYQNFFGSNRLPAVFYEQQGASKLILPVQPCQKSVFNHK